MRLIDADALEVDWYDDYETEDGDVYSCEYVSKYQIDKAPTIDAVPVVRCKDCKRFAPDKDGGDWGMCTDEGSMMLTQKDFGCLGGERKADDETD